MSKSVRECVRNAASTAPAGLERLFVVYSSFAATQVALQYAAKWAVGLTRQIWLVVDPAGVPAPYDEVLEAALAITRWFRRSGRNADAFQIYVTTAREDISLASQFPDGSVLIVAGPKRWPPSAEEKLVKRLKSKGHQVLFVITDPPGIR